MRRVWKITVDNPNGTFCEWTTVEPTFFETQIDAGGVLSIFTFMDRGPGGSEFIRSESLAAGTWARAKAETREYGE